MWKTRTGSRIALALAPPAYVGDRGTQRSLFVYRLAQASERIGDIVMTLPRPGTISWR
jgi:hypothetical protein